MLLSDLLKAPSNCDPVSNAHQIKIKKSSLNRTGLCLQAGRKPIGSFLSDVVLFCAIQSHVILNELFNQDDFVFDVDLHLAAKRIKQRKMQIARFSGRLRHSAFCNFYRFLPQFCSLPVMGFNGLTQFTNMKTLDEECIYVYHQRN